MSVMVDCECGRRLRVDESFVGRNMRCPNCGLVFQVADPSAAAEPAAEPAPPPEFTALPWYQPLGWFQPVGDFGPMPEFEPVPMSAPPPPQPAPQFFPQAYPHAPVSAVPVGPITPLFSPAPVMPLMMQPMPSAMAAALAPLRSGPPPSRSGYPRAEVRAGQVRNSPMDVGRPEALLAGPCLHCRGAVIFSSLGPAEAAYRPAGLEVRKCALCSRLVNVCARCLTINPVDAAGPHAACVECGSLMGM